MTQENFQINSAAITDRGLSEKRPENEDSYLELRDSGFFAVADGVGGAQAGDVASEMAMEILGEAFINLREGGDAEERMKLAIEQANAAIYQMSKDIAQLSTMATTVVGLHLAGNIATIGHVGDSRLYRVDPQGTLFRETQDHSVVEEEVRAGRLTPAQAETHPSRNVISRALGAEDIVEIDMKTIMFDAGTTFLICSDGVTRHISDDEIQKLLSSEQDTFAVCQYIKDVCYERGAEDNLTAVVVKALEMDYADSFAAAELDEDTVAAARPAFANSSVLTDAVETSDSENFANSNNADEFRNGGPITIAASAEAKSNVSIRRTDEEANLSSTKKPDDERTYRVDEGSAGGFGRMLSILPWVLLGLLVLVGGYYYLSTQPTTGGIEGLQSQSPDVSMTAFEQNRRNVDADPAQYVARFSANPQDAVDYFLLGRAYLLQKNYESAKNHLERSSSMLVDGVSPSNKRVLENEIPMMLAIIESDDARASFEKGVAGDAVPEGAANSNK